MSASTRFHITFEVAADVPRGTDLHDLERRVRELLAAAGVPGKLEQLLRDAGGVIQKKSLGVGWPKTHFGAGGGVICGVGHAEEPLTTTDPSQVDCKMCRRLLERGAAGESSVVRMARKRRP
jgi:hypothetical protein